MIERRADIATSDGMMNVFVCHPERNGPHPMVHLYMDAPGMREELRDMARRLATVGYYVMLPNLYYRLGLGDFERYTGAVDAAAREAIMSRKASLTIDMVMRDADAMIGCAAADAAASRGAMGCVGYCMSGQFAINLAARHPGRMRAAASIYGTDLITERADSPHLAAQRAQAKLYFACAEKDHWAPLQIVERLRSELQLAEVAAEIEIYPGVEHGFAFPDRRVYDKMAAERHWERLFALFAKTLRDI